MKRFITISALSLIALPALAQSSDGTTDWEVIRLPQKKAVIAAVPFTSGLTVATRCIDGSFSAILTGLPEAARRTSTRELNIAFRDKAPTAWRWNVTTDSTAVMADYPASFARMMREGGHFRVSIPDGAGPGRALVHDLQLPASSAAIDETLSACGRPSVDPRDAELAAIGENGLPDGVVWARAPRPYYPSNFRYAEGFAVLSCLNAPDGRLRDCVIESENPNDGGFGEAALQSARSARVTNPNEQAGQLGTRRIGFRVNFRIQ